MTAQGEDILAYLDRVITGRVDAALKTLDLADRAEARRGRLPARWVFLTNPATRAGEIRDADEGMIRARSTWPDEGRHIALNDPASVLLRSAADRKLIELHRPIEMVEEMADACSECEVSGDYPYYPCPTLRILAEGYGWTEGER